MTNRKKKAIAIVCISVFLLASIVVLCFVGKPLLQFVSEPERFREWVNQNGILGRVAFVGMVILQVLVAIIPGEPLEVGAGYAFGAFWGTLLCLVGSVVGSAFVFALVRRYGIRVVELFFSKEKIESLTFLQNTEHLYWLIFLVFFLPGTPKDILSYCAGLTQIKWIPWLAISSVARIPSILTSTIGGDALGVGNLLFAGIVFVLALCLSVFGLLVYRKIGKKQREKEI